MEDDLIECSNCGAKNNFDVEFCSFCHVQLKKTDRLQQLKSQVLARVRPKEQPIQFSPAFGNLKGEYFIPPKKWFFNNPVLFTYARLFLYSLLSILLIVFISYFFLIQRPVSMQHSSYEAILSLYKQGGNPDGLIKQIDEFQKQYPKTKQAKSLTNLKDSVFETKLAKAMNQAESQPSYPLKIETYEFILKNYQNIESAEKEKMEKKIKTYKDKLTKIQLKFAVIEKEIQKQYFTSSLKKIDAILKEGEILGEYYTKGIALQEKAHIERINYYLVKAQLRNAKKSLDSAKAAKIQSPKIIELEKKINKLLKI